MPTDGEQLEGGDEEARAGNVPQCEDHDRVYNDLARKPVLLMSL